MRGRWYKHAKSLWWTGFENARDAEVEGCYGGTDGGGKAGSGNAPEECFDVSCVRHQGSPKHFEVLALRIGVRWCQPSIADYAHPSSATPYEVHGLLWSEQRRQRPHGEVFVASLQLLPTLEALIDGP